MGSTGHIIGADGNIYIGKSILNPDGAEIGTLSIEWTHKRKIDIYISMIR
jgi:hypothetical protein